MKPTVFSENESFTIRKAMLYLDSHLQACIRENAGKAHTQKYYDEQKTIISILKKLA